MSSHKHHPPHAVSRCPHNTRVKRELLLILVRFRMSETPRGPGRRWTGRPAVQKKWAPRPGSRDALETRPGEGLEPWPPLTALGEGSVGRSIGGVSSSDEAAASRPARPVRPLAFAAHGFDGAAEIRRCVPTPSPFHSPPPPLRRPGKFGRAVLSPKFGFAKTSRRCSEIQHGPLTHFRQYWPGRYSPP